VSARRRSEWLVLLGPLLLVAVAGGVYLAAGSSTASPHSAPSAVASPALATASATPDGIEPAAPSATPTPTPTVSFAPPSEAAAALALLDEIEVANSSATGYVRAAFGPGWGDPDRNGCDARNDVLARDLTDVVFREGTYDCVVLTGRLDDPYTGTIIHFQHGNDTSTLVQIDHVVPLAWAWRYGAYAWSDAARAAFHSDQLNLLAVDGAANQSKSDGGPSEWLPANTSMHCDYAVQWVRVLDAYDLSIPSADRSALSRILVGCE
tara:strand:+ start:10359 stop:11153 length:795 start_codon:yes stop_codon:yes gene_type:complete